MSAARHATRQVLKVGFVALWMFVAGGRAQVAVGDEVKMSLNGNLGIGYSGNFGNAGTSGHGLFGTGMGLLSGSYYNPNFLSFNVRPFYNRNQDNGAYTSILSETGVDASTTIFGGSHFPGSMSYTKSFAKGSQYGLPGTASLSADSDTQNFSTTWSELLPNLPSLTATFSDNTSSSTILGQPGTSDTASKIFNALSNYKIHGYQLTGFVTHQNYNIELPAFLAPTNTKSDSATTSYGISANHTLPLSGTVTMDYNRTDYDSQTGAFRASGTTDTADTTVAVKPLERLSVSGQVRYTGNLVGALRQTYLAGQTAGLFSEEETSHGVALSTYAAYQIGHGFGLVGYANRQIQDFAGTTYDFHQAGGTLTYSYARPLFGLLYLSFGMVNNGTTTGGNSLGFVGNADLKKRIRRWEYNADFSYSQNVQAIIANYTTSGFNYGGSVRRRFASNMFWSGSYRGTRTGVTQIAGSGNRADSFVTNLVDGRYDFSASFSKSHGTALLSSTGTLTPTPVATLLTPEQIVYAGKVYGVGASVTPLKRMLINVNWYRVRSDTQTTGLFSQNNSERYYGQLQYNLRKLSFRAGYWRVYQGVGANVTKPTLDNTYFFNVSRWFNVF
jgi:hypothetical protein